MVLIGSHVSFKSSEQLLGSVKEIISYGGNSFMIYTGAPQNTKRCKIDWPCFLALMFCKNRTQKQKQRRLCQFKNPPCG